jgi:GNAT superfamily N-acetyltransferase
MSDTQPIEIPGVEPCPAVIEIVRALISDDMRSLAEQVTCNVPGRTSFQPGFRWQTLLDPQTRQATVTSLIWAAHDGAPKGIATLALCNRAHPISPLRLGELGITVHREYRRRGLASMLLDNVLEKYRINLSGQLCMEEGATFLAAYLVKREIPFVEREQTPEELVNRLPIPPTDRMQDFEHFKTLLLEWVMTTPAPRTYEQFQTYLAIHG